jgi:uncharacterized protein (TIGR03437 family)
MKNLRLFLSSHFCSYLALVTLFAGTVAAQPNINANGVVNVASYAGLGQPNYSVAQGSIFAIFGTGLGPATAAQVSTFPLGNTFQGVSISVSQGGVNVAALPLYVSAGQINAVMPSTAPIGSDTITVTYNGQNSGSATVSVVTANFGIFAANQQGSGQGVVTSALNQAVSYTASAAPSQVVNLWGTGLGAINGSDTEPPPAGNILASSPTVYVGGVQVTPTYHGRSPCCSGVDQIQFQVPPNITGCNVPVAVQIGSVVSNFVSLAIAANGGACSDLTGISAADFASFATQGALSAGYISLSRGVFGNSTDTLDYGYANFEQYPYPNFSLTQLPIQLPNYGACSVYTSQSTQPPFQVATPTVNFIPGVALDAGAAISVSGPDGTKQITPVAPPYPASVGNYYTELGGPEPNPQPPLPLYLVPGSYTIAGTGGKNVGPFTANVTMATPLTWINQSNVTIVTRTAGITVSWSGANPNSYVIISGTSMSVAGSIAGFNCTANASAGQFTVPAGILLALPPSVILMEDGQSQPLGTLTVASVTPPVRFNATGLNLGLVTTSVSFSQIVQYQ